MLTISLVRVQSNFLKRLLIWVFTVTISTQRASAIWRMLLFSNSNRTNSRSAWVRWDTVWMKNSRLRSELRSREYSLSTSCWMRASNMALPMYAARMCSSSWDSSQPFTI